MKDLFNFEKSNEYDYPSTMKEIDEMKGAEFEYFIFRYLKDYGDFDDVQYTKPMDYGIDVVVDDAKNGVERRYGVQCKRYGPNTRLEQNELVKMMAGVKNHAISKRDNGKPYIIVYTTTNPNQVTGRAREFIDNNEIKVYYRDTIIGILKQINKDLRRETKKKDYENIAYSTTHQSKGSFKQNSKLVDHLKDLRKKISKYNKFEKLYYVYTDKTIADIVEKKPKTIDQLKNVQGMNEKKVGIFGGYLVKELNKFYKTEMATEKKSPSKNTKKQPIKNNDKEPFVNKNNSSKINKNDSEDEKFRKFLKDQRNKISDYNKMKPVYHVFNNATLEEIVKVKPTTLKELKNIRGVGEKKTEIFGPYLVRKIKEFLKK